MKRPEIINVISDRLSPLFDTAESHRVRSLAELRGVLDCIAAEPSPERYLDLRGHSTRNGKLLRLGETVIDMCHPSVDGFFRELARDGVLARTNVVGVRLLGCETAVQDTGQLTMRLLARVLGVRVYGAKKPLLRSHHDEAGFHRAFEHILVESSELPDRWRRMLQRS
jgi:hypothetical protein